MFHNWPFNLTNEESNHVLQNALKKQNRLLVIYHHEIRKGRVSLAGRQWMTPASQPFTLPMRGLLISLAVQQKNKTQCSLNV